MNEDVLIRNCENATITIPNSIGALYLTNLKKCILQVGPVSGSIIIRECTDSKISICAKQIRIHECRNCTFYTFCTSSPVIERSTTLLFGSYNFVYKGVQDDMKRLNFLVNNKKILDFDQPTKKKSSNWNWIDE
jgi:hypothetical protein